MESKITVRKPKFDFNNEIPEHWLADSALFTHLANALFLSFPQGERFFMRSVQHFARDLTNEELKAEIKAFVGQESQHSHVHEEHFELLREQGYPVEQILKSYKLYASDGIENLAESLFGKKMHLAMTAAAEHYTALFAEQAYETGLFEFMHPTMGKLAAWHAAEELEHKSVAFDVMNEAGITYAERMLGMVFVSALLSGVTALGMAQLLLKDENVSLMQLVKNLGLVAGGLLPVKTENKEDGRRGIGPGFLGELVKGIADYIRPDFHPDQRDNREYARQMTADDYLVSA